MKNFTDTRLYDRLDWEMWSGVEVEGSWSGVQSLFVKTLSKDSYKEAVKYSHVYVLREAVGNSSDKAVTDLLLFINHLVSYPGKDIKVTLEVPMDGLLAIGMSKVAVEFKSCDKVRIQLCVNTRNKFLDSIVFDNSTGTRCTTEVRFDTNEAYNVKCYSLVSTDSPRVEDYAEDEVVKKKLTVLQTKETK